MKYDDIDKAAELRQNLDIVNRKISNLWSINPDPALVERFGSSIAYKATESATETIRVLLVRERNDIIQKLNTMGITFREEAT